jgi:acetyl-CoA carboxylase biotin carboxyl carrier protein
LLTFEQIKELIELVAQRHLQGVEIERSGFRLKIDGQAQAMTVAYAPPVEPGPAPLMPVLPPALPTAPSGPPAGSAASPGAAAPADEGAHVVTSPIVGTFYRASAPDADPFVEVGSRVKKGQVLCIIEAMKLMNEIESDADGVVATIYPQNAQAVEYGEPLFAIRAD